MIHCGLLSVASYNIPKGEPLQKRVMLSHLGELLTYILRFRPLLPQLLLLEALLVCLGNQSADGDT